MTRTHKPAVAILGPTASGKTKLGVAVSKALLGEVISVDSLQCYKPGSIVTAKPEHDEIQDIPHHLIDYLEADEEPDDFISLAINKMEDIIGRNKIPVLVGGSTSLTIPLLQQALKNHYIIVGIMLVPHPSNYQQLIETRGDSMVKQGLLAELRELKALEKSLLQGAPDFNRGVWKAIGYPEFYPYLDYDGTSDTKREVLYHQGVTMMRASTLQYGFNQLEWLRHTLTPFLHRQKVATISLNVTDKQSWATEVEGPALSMANQFFHGTHSVTHVPGKVCNPRVVCLFGGSSSGNDPSHVQAAKELSLELHRNNITLIYGGGTTGVMGAAASTLVELSGPSSVHGIVPAALAKFEEKETGQSLMSKFGSRTVVRDMHTRKRLMIEAVLNGGPGSGFVALSGGYGTMEELLEIATWYQLGIHDFNICVLNVDGFYDGLLEWVSKVSEKGFIGAKDRTIIQVATSAEGLVRCLEGTTQHSEQRRIEWI
ncbi:Bifunctional cytokinin biosynthesis protein [Fusarium oxysporum f. sp. rapae]|uniref:Bifunctional cytokinin biosynthesis protein n=1 Tax=Fusarium oxysporum f. sp. rapae TaxID=485398 RepID=A0A8J5UGD6_FUSOX|nr:Bifunctional cytokinin biosynthesis protein [Fusarium oxysporum f. sp. rapae]